MSTYARLADLPLRIDSYALEGLEREVSSAFTRASTVIRLSGGDHEGFGEDVTYESEDQLALQEAGPNLALAGEHTIESFSRLIESVDLWPSPPAREPSLDYRRWAYESAALDLALNQAGRSLAETLDREPRPVSFVVSLRLPDPPTIEPIHHRLERYPNLRFKLDPTSAWDEELIAALAATGAVDSVDLKGAYEGTTVDQPADPRLYRAVVEAFPEAWIEDPKLRPETEEILAGEHDRITWDAVIHSVADIDALAFPPRMVNLKPSRFGSLRALCAAYDLCEEREIGAYGGGQFELGPGRGQIQYLASLFHPDTPNDVAPGGYNEPDPPPGLPESPLAPQASRTGFRWGDWA